MGIKNRYIILLFVAVALVFTTACTTGFDSFSFRGESSSQDVEGMLAIITPKAGDYVPKEVTVEGGCVEKFNVFCLYVLRS